MGLLNGRWQKYLHKMKEVKKKGNKTKKEIMGNRYSKGESLLYFIICRVM